MCSKLISVLEKIRFFVLTMGRIVMFKMSKDEIIGMFIGLLFIVILSKLLNLNANLIKISIVSVVIVLIWNLLLLYISFKRKRKKLKITNSTSELESISIEGVKTDTSSSSEQYHYWAFISYSSEDEKRARWLHRAIEKYGIPAKLVNHPIPSGFLAPRRFYPLFRDRDELPASSNLGDQIEEALRASHYLIVICTPAAAKSKWVNREVEFFDGLDRKNRILAFIAEGEPNSVNDKECFPPSLRTCEPIAADGRPHGDGKNNAKLKLLAGMLGVSFDAIKQRDEQRRIHHLELMLAGALLLIFGISALAWLANLQRLKAVKARQEAEGLIKYMLYDLSDKLKPIGKIDLMYNIYQLTVDYYKKQDSTSIDGYWNNIQVFNGLAKIATRKGDLLASDEYYTTALLIAFALEQEIGFNDDLSVIKCELLINYSGVQIRLGNFTQNLESIKASNELLNDLYPRYPDKEILWHLRAMQFYEMGEGEIQSGSPQNAEALLQSSYEIYEYLTNTNKEDLELQYEFSKVCSRYGECLLLNRNIDSAREPINKGFEIANELVRNNPKDRNFSRRLAVALDVNGHLKELEGDINSAIGLYNDSLSISKILRQYDPENYEWRMGMMVEILRLAELYANNGQVAESRKMLNNADDELKTIKESNMQNENVVTRLEQVFQQTRAKIIQ